ncbi:CD3324 family protein [Ureibacillus aquaedulcis]|uniref:CD3324 family protein n=1 Tax=Ureibacillus aquaedulcis TaxID=3058421 RepID=A0ABT8GW39_9BACL|nr:CD3324 family protein [Ureibacillus sp. BA0131]MDN4495628.1 CD3324 family protein [Ureibacillus sp. BA0131]
MRYVNAHEVLPEDLLMEVQKYVQGDLIYIPKSQKERIQWGVVSGERQRLQKRNEQIKKQYQNGTSLLELAEQYHLSMETIKKIIYKK